LIRTDLLKIQNRFNKPNKIRNIFSWEVFKEELLKNDKLKELGNEEESLLSSLKKRSDNKNLLPLNVKYIGFVSSKKKILGVLLVGKEEIIVKEGDIIENIGKIKKITAKEVEIIVDNSKIIKIPIEEKEEFIF